MIHKHIGTLLRAVAGASLLLAGTAQAASLEAQLDSVQHGWAQAYYAAPKEQKDAAFAKLIADADAMLQAYPARAEALTWHAIVLSSAAKFGGGLSALGQVKQARKDLQQAEQIDPRTLDGSVYSSLGSLYANVPGWPIAFGDKKQADAYLQKALAINPDGIDPNFFYAELLAARGDKAAAKRYYEKALAAPPRPGREDADNGRRAEIRAALARLDG
ncbi:tetratricopeptide repeat protein [Solimonas soli]|uniref:tetratricopeptide repeat protein n=1 Tax=Solimonas soli TaxID=413479 RepID=UPI0004887F18|nr:tetratricopeptide repeat protein [Solimonas soli]